MANPTIDLAFNSKRADERKDWITNTVIDYDVEEMIDQPISYFINHELIQFSIEDVRRSIPSFLDGFKISQRKIVWGAINYKPWRASLGTEKSDVEKLDSLACYISSFTGYHHAPKSLEMAIVTMAQNFAGANNMPLFYPKGQFGNRNEPRSGASRYLKTKPQWFWPYIFVDDDKFLYDQIIEEDKKTEPKTFYPILPLQLINGCLGIGTGWSSFVPMTNPLDLANWVLCKIRGKPLPQVLPWYKGFRGSIKIVDRKASKKPVPEENPAPMELNPEEEENLENRDLMGADVVGTGKYSLVTTGTFEVDGVKRGMYNVTVSELPIGRFGAGYKQWLEQLIEDKKITRYEMFGEESDPSSFRFVIYGMMRTTNR